MPAKLIEQQNKKITVQFTVELTGQMLRNYLKTDNRESLRYHNNAQASLIRPR